MEKLFERYPIAVPAVGLALSTEVAVSLLFRESQIAIPLALLSAAGALLNGWVLLRRLSQH